ncbi:MAG TPA: hypothetical protein VHF69_13500, partial [Candidatus Synoicihabitans sp.]|nr:hypothetical protein [Candidatus Synoicihabitans sp.]
MKFRDAILAQLGGDDYRPVNDTALARALGIDKRQRRQLSHEIRLLLSRGELTLVGGDRLALASAAKKKPTSTGEVVGKLQFRAGGSAFVIPESDPRGPRLEAIQVSGEDTGVGFHGDKVRVQLDTRRGRAPSRHGGGEEQRGRVIAVLERGRDVVVGEL